MVGEYILHLPLVFVFISGDVKVRLTDEWWHPQRFKMIQELCSLLFADVPEIIDPDAKDHDPSVEVT